MLNAVLKRCVFGRFLEISGDVTFRIVGGRIFHSVGTAMEKDRSPRVLNDFVAGFVIHESNSTWKWQRHTRTWM